MNSSQGNLSTPFLDSMDPNLHDKQGLRRLSQPGKLQPQNADGQSRRKHHPLRAKTIATLRNHEEAHFDYIDPAHMTASLSSLVDTHAAQPDRLFPQKSIDSSLSTVNRAVTALSRSEAYLPQLCSDPDRLSSSSRVRRFFQGLKRSLSFHQVGRHEQVHNDIHSNPYDSHQLCPAHLPASDTWRTERRGTRLSRFFRCITTTNTVHSPGDSKLVFSSRNYTRSTSEWNRNLKMESLSSIHLSSCPGAFDPRASLFTEPDCLTARQHLMRNTTRADSMDSLNTPKKIVNPWTSQCLTFPPTGYSLSVPGLMQFGTVHPSLAGGREFCFFCAGPTISTFWCGQASNVKRRDLGSVTRIFAAQSELNRSRWIKSLRRTVKPNLQNERHRENSLRLSILEARNLPTKRRYYCDICLDRTLYARTTSKTATDGIFWAEDFDLNNLPNVSVVTLSLYKEADVSGKDSRRFGTARLSSKKHRKSQNQLIGFVTIPVSEISTRNDTQVWITLQSAPDNSSRDALVAGPVQVFNTQLDCATNGLARCDSASFPQLTSAPSSSSTSQLSQLSAGDTRTQPQLRIRVRYQSIEVLPVRNYWDLKTFILEHGMDLTLWLESTLSVKAKEEVASSLVSLHEYNGTVVDFLTNLVMRDMANLENDSMAFRSNTMATKAVESFVKLAGSSYLHDLLHRLVQRVLGCMTAWEVNPEKLPSAALLSGSLSVADTAVFARSPDSCVPNSRSTPGSLMSNQLMLLHHLHAIWRAVQASLPRFPRVLIRVFGAFRTALESTRGAEFCDNLISACIFLRLICPALLSPSLFGLISAFPGEPSCQRNLTLLAKSLQSLANFSAFDDKEPYMRFLNGYVTAQLPLMRQFIRNISTWPSPNEQEDLDSHTAHGLCDLIDEGFELANLHLLLTELFVGITVAEESERASRTRLPNSLFELPQLLAKLSNMLVDNPPAEILESHRSSRQQTESGPATLPSRFRHMGNNPRLSTCNTLATSLSSSDNQLSTEYAYHPIVITSTAPYYTLHQNPGVRNPNDQQSASVNILSPQVPIAALSVDAQTDCPVARFNVNDYDEPYASSHTDSGDDSCGPDVATNARLQMIESKASDHDSAMVQLPTRSSGGLSADSVMTDIEVEEDDEPIYDSVHLSDNSSTDDVVQANERYLSDLSDVHLTGVDSVVTHTTDTADRTQNPPKFTLSTTEVAELPSPSPSLQEVFSNRPTEASNGLSVKMVKPNLSPRLMPRQVATASVRLTRANVADATSTINLRSIAVPFVVKPRNTVKAHTGQHERPDEPSPSETGPTNEEWQTENRSTEGSGHTHKLDRSAHDVHSHNGPTQSPSIRAPLYAKGPLSSRPTPSSSAPSFAAPGSEETWSTQTSSYTSFSGSRGSADHLEVITGGLEQSSSQTLHPSPEELFKELVHVRRQLELSRENAARAANRLSQQEAELMHLRQLVGENRTEQTVHRRPLKPFLSSKPNQAVHGAQLSSGIVVSPKSVSNVNTDQPVLNTTFDELDDAMARLEQEQAELQREQLRIRARLVASRLAQSASQSTAGNSNPSSHSSNKQPPQRTKAGPSIDSATNRAQTPSLVYRFSGSPSRSMSYGPRVRHNPPPPPRNHTSTSSSRYAH
ncbi:uncharacterized protein DEA37_0001377 [Paragonimus westermani]|uniref:Uncharacterized protein n=1 Tax=Paragonimus westermani TaxID=34504 RepID=A0A5J4NX09_9TREM|nr:uncharacterized protein DEA37_0001377 [Paragonimus westermani]